MNPRRPAGPSIKKDICLYCDINSTAFSSQAPRFCTAVEKIFEKLLISKSDFLHIKNSGGLVFCKRCYLVMLEVEVFVEKIQKYEVLIQSQAELIGGFVKNAVDGGTPTSSRLAAKRNVVWEKFREPTITKYINGLLPNPSVRLKLENLDHLIPKNGFKRCRNMSQAQNQTSPKRNQTAGIAKRGKKAGRPMIHRSNKRKPLIEMAVKSSSKKIEKLASVPSPKKPPVWKIKSKVSPPPAAKKKKETTKEKPKINPDVVKKPATKSKPSPKSKKLVTSVQPPSTPIKHNTVATSRHESPRNGIKMWKPRPVVVRKEVKRSNVGNVHNRADDNRNIDSESDSVDSSESSLFKVVPKKRKVEVVTVEVSNGVKRKLIEEVSDDVGANGTGPPDADTQKIARVSITKLRPSECNSKIKLKSNLIESSKHDGTNGIKKPDTNPNPEQSRDSSSTTTSHKRSVLAMSDDDDDLVPPDERIYDDDDDNDGETVSESEESEEEGESIRGPDIGPDCDYDSQKACIQKWVNSFEFPSNPEELYAEMQDVSDDISPIPYTLSITRVSTPGKYVSVGGYDGDLDVIIVTPHDEEERKTVSTLRCA